MNERYTFRGKQVDNGEWVTGYYIKQRKLEKYDEDDDILKCCPEHLIYSPEQHRFFEVDPDTIGQCTELHDKNDVLIFEGDILIWMKLMFPRNPHIQGIVKWNYAKYVVDTGKGDWELCGAIDRGAEIIGNIHDTPELLKGGDGGE
jgi:uncharacterized phage protein (TIGR01671 family)